MSRSDDTRTVGGKEEARLITEFLHLRFRENGTLAEAEEELGLCPSFLSAMKRRGDAKLSVICAAAKVLGEATPELIRRALGGLKTLRPFGPPPRIVVVFQRQEAVGAGLADNQLRELDRARYINPRGVLDALEGVAHMLAEAQRPYALAISTSCYRSLFMLNESLWCFQKGKELAAGKPALEAELRLRIYLLLESLGLSEEAIFLTKEALHLFAEEHMIGGIGESLTAQGLCLLHSGDPLASRSLLERALAYSDSVRSTYLAACLNGLGICYLLQSEEKKAEEFFGKAFSAARAAGNHELAAKVLWASAGLLIESGQIINCLLEALGLLPKHCCIDVTLLSLDLALVYCKSGDLESAQKLGMHLFSVSEQLKFIPAVEDALVKFIDCCIMKNLTVEVCRVTKEKISLSKEDFYFSRLSEMQQFSVKVSGNLKYQPSGKKTGP